MDEEKKGKTETEKEKIEEIKLKWQKGGFKGLNDMMYPILGNLLLLLEEEKKRTEKKLEEAKKMMENFRVK